MKRGQTTLEFILLVGVVAAGTIAMLVYVSRGHQGNLRSQAEQLGALQYAPGNTTINNGQSKTLASTTTSGNWTRVEHGNLNQKDEALEDLYKLIRSKWAQIYDLRIKWERLVETESYNESQKVRQTCNLGWEFPSFTGIVTIGHDIDRAIAELNGYYAQVKALKANWEKLHPKTKDKTTSGSSTSESGTETTNTDTSETLGVFKGDPK
jgi:hypothetical protein